MFFGRRIEQGLGYIFARYVNSGRKENELIDPRAFMPHEEIPVLTYEEERLKQIKKKSG